jgi:hypothetical protein
VSYGTAGSTLNDELNRLANGGTYPPISDYLDMGAAAQAWAIRVNVPLDTTTDVVGVLNLIDNRQKPKSQWLDIAGICNLLAGTTGLEPAAALREIAN